MTPLRVSVAIAIAALALPGCARPTWTKPGLTQAELARDADACREEASHPVRAWRPRGVFISKIVVDDTLYRRCMVAKGYSSTGPQSGEAEVDRNRGRSY